MLKKSLWLRVVLTVLVFAIDLLVWGGHTETFNRGNVSVWLVIGIGVIGYSTLLIRSTPLPAYIVMLLLSFAGFLLPAVESFAGFLLALFMMARWAPTRQARWALAGAIVPVAENTITGITYHEAAPLSVTLLSAGLWAMLMLVAWITGRALARGQHRLHTERRWAEESREEAKNVERLRISRDLHDSVAHSLTGIVLQVAGVRAAIKQNLPAAELDGALADVQHTAEQSMRELHRLLGMLRTAEPEGKNAAPKGIADIDGLICEARASGVDVSNQVEGTPVKLDPSIEHAGYRVVQEGLSNAMKHGGEGVQVVLQQTWAESGLTLSVRSISGLTSPEQPTAPGTTSGGYGLLGLRERVTVSGGTLTSGPTKDGFLLKANLPTTSNLEKTL